MAWSASDVQIVFDVLGTDDPIVTAAITTTAGLLRVMATVQRIGRLYAFEGLHIHAEDVAARGFGGAGLLRTLRALLEIIDADEIIIRGAVRTTGANPEHRPRDIRVARKVQPEA